MNVVIPAVAAVVGVMAGSKLEQLIQVELREMIWRQCHEHAYSGKFNDPLIKMNDCLDKAHHRIK